MNEIKSFKSLHDIVYRMVEGFFRSNLEMAFRHFEPELLLHTINIAILGLKEDTVIRNYCCNAIKELCFFIYETMNKTTEKSKEFQTHIGNLLM